MRRPRCRSQPGCIVRQKLENLCRAPASSKTSIGALRNQVMADVRSPDKACNNGTLPNLDSWYAAFDVDPGDKLYLALDQRVRLGIFQRVPVNCAPESARARQDHS
jgi:hypothetical protein